MNIPRWRNVLWRLAVLARTVAMRLATPIGVNLHTYTPKISNMKTTQTTNICSTPTIFYNPFFPLNT